MSTSRATLCFLSLLVAAHYVVTPIRAEQDDAAVIERSDYEHMVIVPTGASVRFISTAGQPNVRRFAQQEESSRKKEEQEEEAESRRQAEEEARLAPTCDPLKNRVQAILQSAGTASGSFNQALSALREIEKQLPTSCPKKIQIFSGPILEIIPCYNRAIYVKLAEDRAFVLDANTRIFNYGRPQAAGEFIMGITAAPYFCIKSTSPQLVVYAAGYIAAMARRK